MSKQESGNETKPIRTCEECNRSMLAIYLEDGRCYRCRR
jgi:hypothetical protein